MKFHDVDFDTYFRNYPDANGYFGKYGGSYIPPQLQAAMDEITEAYMTICKSSKFINELRRIRRGVPGPAHPGLPPGAAVRPPWATCSSTPSARTSTIPAPTS